MMTLKTLALLIPFLLTTCQGVAFAGEILPIAFASFAKDDLYRSGQKAIDEERWNEAVRIFGQVAGQGGPEADDGLYWKAYAQHKAGKGSDALATIRQLASTFPKSAWLDDARALEVEIRGDQGQPVQPSGEEDEDVRLYALSALMDKNPQKGLTLVQQYLRGNHSPRDKEKALFLLTQSDLPQARQTLLEVARGTAHPELRLQAIEYLGIAAEDDPSLLPALESLYAGGDPRVRRAVLEAYVIAEHRPGLVAAVRTEKDPRMRVEAIEMLGAAEGTAELRSLLASEDDPKARTAIYHGLANAEDVDGLLSGLRAEKLPGVRVEAMHALGNVDSPKATEALLSLYGANADRPTREAVIVALGNQENARGLIGLYRTEKDRELRRQIVRTLADMDSPEAEAFMDKLFETDGQR